MTRKYFIVGLNLRNSFIEYFVVYSIKRIFYNLWNINFTRNSATTWNYIQMHWRILQILASLTWVFLVDLSLSLSISFRNMSRQLFMSWWEFQSLFWNWDAAWFSYNPVRSTKAETTDTELWIFFVILALSSCN